MLTDQELLNLAQADNNVFDEAATPPASPRPTPGIILTVEGSQEIIDVASRHRSKTRSSRRSRHASSSSHRSPSGSRMSSRQIQHQQLRDPSHLSGPGVSRSQSMRTARRPQSVDPAHRQRGRIASIPNDLTIPSDYLSVNQSDEDVTRLRNFAITSKGIVNRGDSFRSKSRSSHSVASIGQSPQTPVHQKTEDQSAEEPPEETPEEAIQVEGAGAESPKPNRYRVLVLGPPDVGKTALINQFMTSEYMCAYDSSQDEENEKSVPVILNGSESELVFSEFQFAGDMSVNFCNQFRPDAYLVVYSVTSKKSAQFARQALGLVKRWDEDSSTKALILVGNKTDLARHRVLSTDDGRSLAIEEGSKFIETSAGINHQVDELLVGILSQIRLKRGISGDRALKKRESVSLGPSTAGAKVKGGRCAGCPGCKAKGILKRILRKACSRTKSCDNLHVL